MSEVEPHRWNFFRAGGVIQARIENGADLMALPELDQKLWVALSCPTRGIEFDTRTLDLMDADGDGRIRPPELINAVNWVGGLLKDSEVMADGSDALLLSAINEEKPEGAALLSACKRVLAELGKPDAEAISVDDATQAEQHYAKLPLNGDGVVTSDSVGDDGIKAIISDILTCVSPAVDRSGEEGVSRSVLDIFIATGKSYLIWRNEANDKPTSLLPFGEATSQAYAAYLAVAPKIDDYFARCRVAEFDERAAAQLNAREEDFRLLATGLLDAEGMSLEGLPLAVIVAARDLSLDSGLNPAWAKRMAEFKGLVLGDQSALSPVAWENVKERFTAHAKWLAAKQGGEVEKLGVARLRDLLENGGIEQMSALIDEDESHRAEAEAIASVERLVRFKRDLMGLANNFVAFRDFYSGKSPATFQVGTLYLDGRSFDLCLKVDDAVKHAAQAGLGRICLVYCDCSREAGKEHMTIVAAVTAGDSDNLREGRNGVFYDRKGNDWDARVIRLVEHPIGIGQAFWGPYRQLGRFVGEQLEKIASVSAKAVQGRMQSGVAATTKPADPVAKPATPAAPLPHAASHATSPAAPAAAAAPAAPEHFDVGRFAGIFAALGLAVGAIGTAIASVVTGFLNLPWWQMPLAIFGLVLAVSGPSMLIAYLKLHQRNLAPALDAAGWAINGRAKINIPFGAALTRVAGMPERIDRLLVDPFAEKTHSWRWIFLIFLAIGIAIGVFWLKS
jgi:hypothetical protein